MTAIRRIDWRRARTTAWDEAQAGSQATSARRRRTPEEARREIIQVARKHISKHGFRDLTVDSLMRHTQIGRSAFYAYFKDVYDLAEIFIHELADQIERAGADWFDREGQPIERIRFGLRSAVAFWEAKGRMIRALEAASMQDERLQRIWRDKVALGPIRRVAAAIERDQAAGLIGPMDPYAMSVALNRFSLTYLNDCFGAERRKNKETVLGTLEHVWLASLYGYLPIWAASEPGADTLALGRVKVA